LINVQFVAPAGGVHVTVTAWPPPVLIKLGLTATAGHVVTFVETDIVGKLTSIVTLGVPVMLVLEQLKALIPWVKVHALIIWPVLSVTG
jgi:hypothetical protein